MKRIICFIFITVCIMLSSCASSEENNKSDNPIWNMLLKDNATFEDYCKTETLQKENIDDDGYYQDDEINQSEQDEHKNDIHISFAKNNLLNISYYYDEACTNEIIGNECFLSHGSNIYYKEKPSNTQSYQLDGFQLASFEDEQNNFKYDTIKDNVITIPSDYPFSEISIFPIGKYKNRDLSFHADYQNKEENLPPVSIIWIINQGEQEYYTKAFEYSIDSNSEYRVKAQFDSHEYCLIEDEVEPKPDDISEEDGIVTVKFPQYDAQSDNNDYKLVFDKQYPILINSIKSNGGVITILVGDQKIPNVSSYNGYAKAGSVIIIQSTAEITDIVSMHSFKKISPFEYQYTVCEESDTFEFIPSAYTFNHGKVEFYDSNNLRITKKVLQPGETIFYKGIADSGYKFSMGNEKQELKYDSNFKFTLENKMTFSPLEKIELPQPSEGGQIIYYYNGDIVTGKYLSYAEGVDKITADFKADHRYKTNNISNKAECSVKKNGIDYEIQFKNNDGVFISINNVFTFSESQKAELSVKLDNSVGNEMKFYIYNGTKLMNPYQQNFSARYLDQELIDKKDNKIETVSGITIKVSDANLGGDALKTICVMKDNKGNKTTRIYYSCSESDNFDIPTSTGSNLYYEQIDIEIQRVSGSTIKTDLYSLQNAQIEFFYIENNQKEPIHTGDFIDDSREICISIKANTNYQIYKKGWGPFPDSPIEEPTYEKTFKYSDLDDKFEDIKSKIEIRH